MFSLLFVLNCLSEVITSFRSPLFDDKSGSTLWINENDKKYVAQYFLYDMNIYSGTIDKSN